MNSLNTYDAELSKFSPVSLSNLNELKLLNRVDSKYVLPVEKLTQLLEKVWEDYLILEINGQRCFHYDTKYFDSPELNFYLNHQNRRLNRFKIRHRTYAINNLSYLEIKQKTNKGKTIKNRIKANGFKNLDEADYSFIESFVDLPKRNLKVSSANSFNRITLASFKSNERITIDFGLNFSTNKTSQDFPFFAIVELKRAKQVGKSPFAKVLKDHRIYTRGFSKYCMGLALLTPDLKQNSFKKNKLFLKKILNATTIN